MIPFVPLFNRPYPIVSQGGHNEGIVQESSSGEPSKSEKGKAVDSREHGLLADGSYSGANEGAGESDEVRLISVVLRLNESYPLYLREVMKRGSCKNLQVDGLLRVRKGRVWVLESEGC